MSRVSQAVRRAEGHGQEPPSLPDETAFNAREEIPDGGRTDSHERPRGSNEAATDNEDVHQPGRLVRHTPALPLEVNDKGSREDIQVIDILRVLLSRWKWIAAVVVAALSLAVAYNRTATPIYEARARLLIEPDSPEIVPFRTVAQDTSRFDYFVTQLEVLRSRALAELALKKLGLLSSDAMSSASQAGAFVSSLTVSAVKSTAGESRVVNVTFRSTDPRVAARNANALAQAYVDQNVDVRRQKSREASVWLNEQLAGLRQQVHAAQAELQKYRERQDAVSLEDRQNIVVQKLAQLSEAVTTARTEKVERETLYQQLDALQERGEALDTFPPILANTFVQGLKAELAALQREREALAQKFGDLHPDMIKVQTTISVAEQRLNAEIAKIVDGVRNDFRTAEARERNLVAALESQKHEVLDLNQKAIGYGALQREAASTQQIYESVLQRIKETELAGDLQVNNARILDAALVPDAPISPRTFLNLLVALLGGGVMAVLLVLAIEYLNPRIVKPEDVSEALGVPLLGTAPLFASTSAQQEDGLPEEFREALRGLRTRILLSPTTAAARALAVTSTKADEGKTAIARGLAASMAKTGRRVLLVDADVRRPQAHHVFNTVASPGLANVLSGSAKPSDALCETHINGLYVMPAGAGVTNASELLDRDRLTHLIEGFSQVFDLIVLDCPPLIALADASIIANAASSVLFVVAAGTSREGARIAIDRLVSVQAQVIGVFLNKAKLDRLSAYHYPSYSGDDGVARAYRG